MINIKIRVLILVAFAFASCGKSEPKQYVGTIIEATMNSVTVKDLTSDQAQIFSAEGADMSEANGLLIGNIASVDYTGELKEITPATKISTDATYAKTVGAWTMPDPIAPDSVMGVRLMIEGEAESIRMATLRYTGWQLQGEENKILLKGTSEGSGAPIEFSEIAVLGTNPTGEQTLTIGGVVLTKQAE